jgi:septal ring factor EnvC (AmiA/AmiB activator)
VLNEEIARLEIEIDDLRDALDNAIKRNEGLEEKVDKLRGQRDAAFADLLVVVAALQSISDNGGDTLTIEDAVRIADAALTSSEPPDA